jgi:hypothetical protein
MKTSEYLVAVRAQLRELGRLTVSRSTGEVHSRRMGVISHVDPECRHSADATASWVAAVALPAIGSVGPTAAQERALGMVLRAIRFVS